MLILGIVIVLAIMVLPSFWVKRVLAQYSEDRPDFPGSGGEFAVHLIDKLKLEGVEAEVDPHGAGDHYDPAHQKVRLTEDKYNGRSLTAVVVAAHEVGHAIQHHNKEKMFASRSSAAWFAMIAQKVAPVAFLLSPLLASVSPAAARISLVVALISVLSGALLHLITLPVEWDASFGKALPMLKEGGYLAEQDMKAAHKILLAAALTYVAASLISLLNVARWFRYLRRF